MSFRIGAGAVTVPPEVAECASVSTTGFGARSLDTTPIARSGRRVSWHSRHFLFLAVASVALLMASATVIWLRSVHSGDRQTVARIVSLSKSIPFRSIDGRLTGGFPYRPLKGATDSVDAELLRGLELTAVGGTPDTNTEAIAEDLHVRGTVLLLLGDSGKAVKLLERAVQHSSGEISSDRAT